MGRDRKEGLQAMLCFGLGGWCQVIQEAGAGFVVAVRMDDNSLGIPEVEFVWIQVVCAWHRDGAAVRRGICFLDCWSLF